MAKTKWSNITAKGDPPKPSFQWKGYVVERRSKGGWLLYCSPQNIGHKVCKTLEEAKALAEETDALNVRSRVGDKLSELGCKDDNWELVDSWGDSREATFGKPKFWQKWKDVARYVKDFRVWNECRRQREAAELLMAQLGCDRDLADIWLERAAEQVDQCDDVENGFDWEGKYDEAVYSLAYDFIQDQMLEEAGLEQDPDE